MPYYGRRARYSRYSRKRYYRRRGSYLSTKNLLTRKSATAQALQLRAVNRKVNKVYNLCKPEKKVVYGDVIDFHFSNSADDHGQQSFNAPVISKGPGNDKRIGDVVRRRDTYNLTIGYSNSTSTGFMGAPTAYGQVRIICIIDKIPVGQNSLYWGKGLVHYMNDTEYNQTGNQYKYWMVSPLEDGITESVRIVYDKVIKVGLNELNKTIKVKTPWYTCRFEDRIEVNPPVIQSHLILLSGNLDWELTTSEFIDIQGTRKTVFTDA